MVKEYHDDFLGEKAFEKLNKDIDAILVLALKLLDILKQHL